MIKSILNFSIILVGLFFIACNSKPQVNIINAPTLKYSSILKADSVTNFINQFGDENLETAKYYLQKADNERVSNPQKAIWYVKRAITLQPTYESYLKLINLLVENEKYQEAIVVYDFILWQVGKYENKQWVNYYVFKQPSKDLIVDYLVCNYFLDKNLNAEMVYNATNSGYTVEEIRTKFFNDSRINLDKNGEEYQRLKIHFLSDDEINDYAKNTGNFKEFIGRIKNKNSIINIHKDNIADFNFDEFNGMYWEEGVKYTSLNEGFLKERKDNVSWWLKYNIKNAFALNDSFWVLHYAIDTSEIASPKDMRSIYHALAVYDLAGNMVDYKIVANQSGNNLMLFFLNQNILQISEYERYWQKPYVKQDFDNTLLNIEPLKQQKFRINASGRFEPMQAS